MARSSGSKKSHQRKKNNHDDMMREAKKMRKELRSSLEDSRTRVADLETQNLDVKLEIYPLKASHVVSDEVDCADCSMFLADDEGGSDDGDDYKLLLSFGHLTLIH
jgi:hypothetical protein